MCRSPVEIAGRHSTRPRQSLSRRTEMSILEIALASQIWARRHERRQLGLDDADAVKILLRTVFVVMAFALLISGLNLAAGSPPTLVAGSAPAVAER
ncbi:hypothetical protein HJA87_21390 [Rhizobium bangladeshense]|uniref:Uncharacterized protein n=2 Tax=Rhizobium bangladeshense TaxID=1138189 RepID=A0ABS7LLQ9_9HYPH|nr:hypothetical protein [Rhizobium bangladeshense]MBX4884998.1 hypothetical protein [Rhizobium bangladeshense]MBX4891811.1 hypothetical protein [Rhizobium bangladeshense]MBX4914242.1 hypothetical protein [Rhizobium bangladeshense]MBX4919454.1 hypothetical protein [Rhizobium bangladeshense]